MLMGLQIFCTAADKKMKRHWAAVGALAPHVTYSAAVLIKFCLASLARHTGTASILSHELCPAWSQQEPSQA
jgi:hypothetical protein